MVHLNLKGITLLPLDRVMALNTWSHESVSPPGGPHPPPRKGQAAPHTCWRSLTYGSSVSVT